MRARVPPPTGHSDGVGSEGPLCSQANSQKRAAFGCQFIAALSSQPLKIENFFIILPFQHLQYLKSSAVEDGDHRTFSA